MLGNYLLIFYLQLLKIFLKVKKVFYLLLLTIRKNIFLYHLSLRLLAPFSWYKKIALLEFNKKNQKILDLCLMRLEKKPEPHLCEIMARNLRALDMTDEALFYIQKARSLNYDTGSLNYEQGLIYFKKNDFARARQHLEKAIKQGYDTAPLQIHLGKIYYQLGLPSKAEICFRRVLAIYPREGSIYFLLAIVLKNMTRYDEAEYAFLKAVKYGSDQKEEHLGLAEIYTRKNEFIKAIKEYQHVLKIDPDNFVAHYFLGLIYEIQGDDTAAINEMLIAYKLHPNDEEIKAKLTSLLRSTPKSSN